MENNNEQLIVDLRNNIKHVIALFENEKDKRRKLEGKYNEVNELLTKSREEKDKILIQYTNLKLAKSLDASIANSHEAKLKVNRIVREIDKCIALLNK